MKFETLIMENFMRYKGINQIDFSTDKVKNVTVVLGDNTVGKTTLAQAFRWCLYGKLLQKKGRDEKDFVLLNQTVMEKMDADARKRVSVSLILSDDEKRYQIIRQAYFQRKVPSTVLVEYQKKLQLFVAGKGQDDWVEVGQGENEQQRLHMAELTINELLPEKLSHYFLFDGERWSDFEHSGTRENIKESVHILTGLSAMQGALNHLKGFNKNSVLGKFRDKITGSGDVYDGTVREMEKEERVIEQCREKINVIKANIFNHEKALQEIEDFLVENQNTEAQQKQVATMRIAIQSKRNRAQDAYKNFMQNYSSQVYMLAMEPVVRQVLQMMSKVNLERRDIPFMKQATIDHLIERGMCICGTCIEKDGEAYRCLMEQREYLPPADMGSMLGEFEKTARRMTVRNEDNYDELLKQAKLVSDCAVDLENTENQLLRMERQLDENINFKDYRDKQRYHKGEISTLNQEIGRLNNVIESSRRSIEKYQTQLSSLELRNKENLKWRQRVNMTQEVYDRLEKEFSIKEKKVFLDLNERLQKNFYRMFNARDKKIELDKDYNIKMSYKTDVGFRQETNLSEGEKVARNFAFIATIMEFNQEQKANGDKLGDTQPIVLDGPFSKLGDENIHLVSECLPLIAEQVILFMLEKDWKYTGLDEYVGARYYIEKNAEESFAKLNRQEV